MPWLLIRSAHSIAPILTRWNHEAGLSGSLFQRPAKRAESDAIFFLENQANRVLAIHIEFKRVNELFAPGQAEAYPMRAACFAKTHESRPTLNAHHDWATVLFCGPEKLADPRLASFQRVITHGQAAAMLAGYPPIA
jgi:hypothetical protein